MTRLDDWNLLPAEDAVKPILACCGSRAFAMAVVDTRPYATIESLLGTSDSVWSSLGEQDWREAFACHPRIGEDSSRSSRQFAAWSSEEQSRTKTAAAAVLDSIAEKNKEYEAQHGFIYIVCASGRSANELLSVLETRIGNSTAVEITEAAEQQRQITSLRLRKWLTP